MSEYFLMMGHSLLVPYYLKFIVHCHPIIQPHIILAVEGIIKYSKIKLMHGVFQSTVLSNVNLFLPSPEYGNMQFLRYIWKICYNKHCMSKILVMCMTPNLISDMEGVNQWNK